MATYKDKNTVKRAKNARGLVELDQNYRYHSVEMIPVAMATSYADLVKKVVPDPDGDFVHPVYFINSFHKTVAGCREICRVFMEYTQKEYFRGREDKIQFLSVSSQVVDKYIGIAALIRVFDDKGFGKNEFFSGLYHYLNEDPDEENREITNHLVIPEGTMRSYTKKEVSAHQTEIQKQHEALFRSTEETPFLNSIEQYHSEDLPAMDPKTELVYDLLTKDRMSSNRLPYEKFIAIFKRCMEQANSVEKNLYFEAIRRGEKKKMEFWVSFEAYIKKNFIDKGLLPVEDYPALKAKLEKALFELYVVQDLIDDPDVTDIKITGPYSIRCRIHGKAYLSNITFIDEADYLRFIQMIAIRNNIDLTLPQQTFTDKKDENYILRFYITSSYIVADEMPIMQIRKVNRHKLMDKELLQAGMMDEKIRDYLMDCALHSKGVVFAGPPGSGKTVLMNWFLEQYEFSAEILVIQENDELFTHRHGVMFEHVVSNPQKGEQACSLEDLGRLALVAGANVFIIGEVKGGEILYAITLANSGCRTAMTIHSQSAAEATDKMCELALQGNPNLTYSQAKRLTKSFETLVYLKDFKVQEIKQVIGFNEETKIMEYRPIYKRSREKEI